MSGLVRWIDGRSRRYRTRSGPGNPGWARAGPGAVRGTRAGCCACAGACTRAVPAGRSCGRKRPGGGRAGAGRLARRTGRPRRILIRTDSGQHARKLPTAVSCLQLNFPRFGPARAAGATPPSQDPEASALASSARQARGECDTQPGQPLACTAREATEAATRPLSNPGTDDLRSPGR
jgi:hypothetical protein